MNKFKLIVILSTMSVCLNGCIVAGIGAGVGAWKHGNAEESKANTTCKNSYNIYLEKIKASSVNPLTLEQYCPDN
jgi:hypothetical protein